MSNNLNFGSGPCSISQFAITGENSDGTCCSLEGLSNINVGSCENNRLHCPGNKIYIPRLTEVSVPTICGESYHAELAIVDSVTGDTPYRVCYVRGGATTDGCGCLCKIANKLAGPSGCQCIYTN